MADEGKAYLERMIRDYVEDWRKANGEVEVKWEDRFLDLNMSSKRAIGIISETTMERIADYVAPMVADAVVETHRADPESLGMGFPDVADELRELSEDAVCGKADLAAELRELADRVDP